MKTLAVLFTAITLTSCLSSSKPIHLSRITIGMEKNEVFEQLSPREPRPVGAKQYQNGVIEVFQYSRRTPDSWMDNQFYWLYFLDGKLSQWGRPGDWQRQADMIYEIRMR